MSDNQTNDNRICTMLDGLMARQPGDYHAAFDLALSENASLELLGRVAEHCVGREAEWGDKEFAAPGWHKITSLPYVQKMLGAGHSPYVVRPFVQQLCAAKPDHLKGFAVDESVLNLFDLPREFELFFEAMAEAHPSLVLERFDWILEQLTVRHKFHSTGNVLGRAWLDLLLIMNVVTKNITYVESPGDRESLKRLPKEMQIAAAERLYPNATNLVFMGYVLAKGLGERRRMGIEHKIYDARRPDRGLDAPVVYRWLLEGVRQSGAVEEDWDYDWDDVNHLRSQFLYYAPHDWRCLPLQEIQPGRCFVELEGESKKVAIMIPESRVRDDVYAPGVMVFVPPVKVITAQLRPKSANSKVAIYELELHPDRPPTQAMLENAREFFKPR